ncbi:MAG: glycine zipper 2TM domain-containing protein [Arenimonas sp.]
MKRISTSVLALAMTAAIGTSAFAAAQDYGSRSDARYDQRDSRDSRYDYRYDNYNASDYRNRNERRDIATVIRVDERWDSNNNYLRQECWNERSNGYESGYYRDDNGRLYKGDSTANGTLLGALIGGALGNQVGKGDGRKAATVAGAVIGGTIGNNVDRNHDSGGQYRDNSGVTRRCRTVSDGGRFGGYDVTYRYAGQTYHALMNQRPGRTMRVMVAVRPQFEGMASRY